MHHDAPLSVTSLTARLKQLLEGNFARVQVRGEVSRLTRHGSGHLYFTIKDAHASIAAVVWRSSADRIKQQPEEGGEFIFHGHISLYEPQGRYQLVVQNVEAIGAGKLAEEFERRKRVFLERGWFDPAHKRTPPELPKHIAIITSPSSAAYQDVQKVLATRPAWIKQTLLPCVVQGAAAAQSIADAFNLLQQMHEQPDTVLLVRGGGSIEDLWCFNDELVVQAMVHCACPIITGIGHEIDTTLADLAADVRAATPSNAAEMASPDCDAVRKRLPRLQLLQQLVQQQLSHHHRHVQQHQQYIEHRWRLQQDSQHLHLERQYNRLLQAQRQRLHALRKHLAQQHHTLQAINPRHVLARGYSMVTNQDGHAVTHANTLHTNEHVQIHFHDGKAHASIMDVEMTNANKASHV